MRGEAWFSVRRRHAVRTDFVERVRVRRRTRTTFGEDSAPPVRVSTRAAALRPVADETERRSTAPRTVVPGDCGSLVIRPGLVGIRPAWLRRSPR
jgi:hypothetical protein